ncbi:hypothetical protein CSA37_11805 [Candidatus Fermentibacteria bacterium]|nr:MAG: hypothetical protein CSA37_11805 [Candidatus Fermentibacteria bacterium]
MRELFFSLLLILWFSSCGSAPEVSSLLTDIERCEEKVSEGDSVLAAGDSAAAAECYCSAALLLNSGTPERLELASRSIEAAGGFYPPAAPLLLESGLSEAPFLAIRAGGSEAVSGIIRGLNDEKFDLPDYVALLAAESLLTTDPSLAESLLFTVDELPGRAGKDLLLIKYRVALNTGNMNAQQYLWSAAMEHDDDEMASHFFHFRGMARGASGIDDLIRSFSLWPASDLHASAYRAIRDRVLQDNSIADELIDPFYLGGLWNEVHDIAVNSLSPPSHAVYLGARTRDRLGRYEEAIHLLETYLDRWPDGDDAPNATIYLARDLAAVGEVERAMETLNLYERKWPSHSRISNLPWYRGSLLAENGRWEESIPYFLETVRRYPSNTTVDDAQFYHCMALMKTGRTEEAIEALGNFNARWTESVYRPGAQYWYGVLKLQSGDESGHGVLESLIRDKSESMPAFFAREFLGLPPWEPEVINEPLGEWMARNGKPEAEPPQCALDGLTLMNGGCRTWALDLFRQAEEEVGDVYMLAPFYLANDVWERGPSAAWRIWSLEDDNRPLDLWKLRYPAAWPEEVLSATAQFQMDPLLLWSIMKQESAFQPGCYSTAGARGLIQMIPSTSEYVAIEHGWDETYSPDILYDPATSVHYGTACISGYGESFNWDIPGTLAAYNGGPHNALRWGWEESSPEEFYSRITYNETKKYVDIVSYNYLVYKHIWPEYSSAP